MPEQITRLLIFFLLILLAYFVVRPVLIPPTYGLQGRYRAAALGEIQSYEGTLVEREACADCHGDVSEALAQSRHAQINCQSCHGPGGDHVSDPLANRPFKATAEEMRQFCGLCHHERAGRPLAFPQVDIEEHMDGMACSDCHSPHDVESMSP
jgi:formate-dependent nitrite reductase cytochrome c552 subunit